LPESVVAIGASAFRGCGLTNVVIPAGVTNIPESVFDGCSKLIQVALPAGLKTISDRAFQNCGSLKTAAIPATVTAVGNSAFAACGSLTDAQLSNTDSLGGAAFLLCSSLTNVVLSESLKTIYSDTFSGCASLKRIVVPAAVSEIGDGAFFNCSSLEEIILPEALTSIGYGTFWNTGLLSVTMPAKLTSIGTFAFANCTNLSTLYFEGDAPLVSDSIFFGDASPTIYYSSGTSGWQSTFAGAPAVLWNPTAQSLEFKQNHLSFVISGATNATVIVEATASLNSGSWTPVSTNRLDAAGLSSFTDAESASRRFYRFSSSH
jgi:hypothetical protein